MVTYHEHILKKAKKPIDLVFCVLTPVVGVLAAYIMSFVFLAILPVMSFLVPALWALCFYLSIKVIMSRNVEFEYLLTDSDLDIDKIINKSRRKRVISVYRKEILVMAPVGSANLPSDWETYTKVDASSSPDAPDAYVLIVQQDSGKKAIIFCPTEKMLETITMRNPRKVFNN